MSALPPEEKRRAAAAAWRSLTEDQRQAIAERCKQYWSQVGLTDPKTRPAAGNTAQAAALLEAIRRIRTPDASESDPDIPAHCLQCLAYAEAYFAEWGVYPWCDDPVLIPCYDCPIGIPCQEPGP